MTRRRYILGYTFYLCGSYLAFVGLSRWPPFVNAAEPSLAGSGRRRLAASPNSDGACSGGEGEAPTHGSLGGEEAATTMGTAANPPPHEADEGPSSSGPAAAPSYASLTPRWCTGEGIPFLQLCNTDLPLPLFPEVTQPPCSEWMTEADIRGRNHIREQARLATGRQVHKSERGDDGASDVHRVLWPGREITIDVLEAPGGRNLQGAVLGCGHVVAHGSFGVVLMVQRVENPALSRAEHATSASEEEVARGTPERTEERRSVSEGCRGKYMKRLADAVDNFAMRLATHSQGSLTREASGAASASVSSHSSAPGALVREDIKAKPTRGSPGGKRPSTPLAVASAASVAACVAMPGVRNDQHNVVYARGVALNLVNRKDLDKIFAMKVGLRVCTGAPSDRRERERGAMVLVRRGFGEVRRIWRLLPQGFTPQQLSDHGLVVPLGAAQLRGLPPYLVGGGPSNFHLLNFVQLMNPQLTDLYDVPVSGAEAQQYLVKRLLQLCAYLAAAGLVHMDLKPENIGVSPFGELTLLDWDYVLRDGDRFECTGKPGTIFAAPEVCREALLAHNTSERRMCTARSSVDRWDLGITMYEAVCRSLKFFPCYEPDDSPVQKMACIASLRPPSTSPSPDEGSSPTRPPLLWGRCNPSRLVKNIIYGLLDLDPEKRLNPLKVFVYGDIFRSPES